MIKTCKNSNTKAKATLVYFIKCNRKWLNKEKITVISSTYTWTGGIFCKISTFTVNDAKRIVNFNNKNGERRKKKMRKTLVFNSKTDDKCNRLWISLQIVQAVIQHGARGSLNALPHQVGQFVCVLNRSWHSNGSWPIVVKVTQFVRQLLQMIRLKHSFVMKDYIMRRRYCATFDRLWDQVEVVKVRSGDFTINDGSRWRVVELAILFEWIMVNYC